MLEIKVQIQSRSRVGVHKFPNEDPQIFGATVQILSSRRPGTHNLSTHGLWYCKTLSFSISTSSCQSSTNTLFADNSSIIIRV